ncbi:hypothetical protein NM208_g14618 [Fusarium decemcellulare]|uniref:Uncharacterized protein n=1 Tax=Fusarium decemcellulare TaxID=57161 RepID=A0ACC1RGL1_9HYPO|nr:hypothetical protein NM208_g14618 [Fusarium decemcellulare]
MVGLGPRRPPSRKGTYTWCLFWIMYGVIDERESMFCPWMLFPLSWFSSVDNGLVGLRAMADYVVMTLLTPSRYLGDGAPVRRRRRLQDSATMQCTIDNARWKLRIVVPMSLPKLIVGHRKPAPTITSSCHRDVQAGEKQLK